MKEHFLGTFYGNEIVLKSDKDIDWSNLYENWLSNQKKQAVQEYKDSLMLRELEVKLQVELAYKKGVEDERERIVKDYGFFNNGCGCCSDEDLKDVLSVALQDKK